MKNLKFFEEYSVGEDSISSNSEEKLQTLKDFTEKRSEFYGVPNNQIKVDLFYGLKWEIREWLGDVDKHGEKTIEDYHRRLNNEIDGILYKFSEGKYTHIKIEDKKEIKNILLNLIDERIPFNEVDYYYTYDLQGKLMTLLEDFLIKIQEKDLFK